MSDEVLGFAEEVGKDIARLQGRIYEGSGSPVDKIAAPVGAIYTDSTATTGAIRWIKTSGTGTTGWRVEYGDTGLRDVSNLVPAGAGWGISADRSGVILQRVGPVVFLTVADMLNDSGASGYVNLAVLPLGFRPLRNQYGNTWRGVRTYLRQSGQLDFSGPSASYDYWSFSWTTDDIWPTSLPGTPV